LNRRAAKVQIMRGSSLGWPEVSSLTRRLAAQPVRVGIFVAAMPDVSASLIALVAAAQDSPGAMSSRRVLD